MRQADPSEFMPTDVDKMADVYCRFPVPTIARLIHAVEERLYFTDGELTNRLLDTLERSLREIAVSLKESCVYDDVSIVVCYDDPVTLDQIKANIARACYFYWQHNLAETKEAQEALKAATSEH
jgi:hypothetical protein